MHHLENTNVKLTDYYITQIEVSTILIQFKPKNRCLFFPRFIKNSSRDSLACKDMSLISLLFQDLF